MKRITFFIPIAAISFFGFTQKKDSVAIRFSEYVTSAGMKSNLEVLASDEYEGRETGMKGQKMSADFIAAWFKSAGIPPVDGTYFQKFDVVVYKPQEISIQINKNSYIQGEDFYSPSSVSPDTNLNIAKIVFAGFGINTEKYNDYKDLNVKGRTVLIMGGELLDKKKKSAITGTAELSDWSTNHRFKYNEAKAQGVGILFIADPELKKSMAENSHRITSTRMTLAEDSKEPKRDGPLVIYISEEMGNEILSASKNNIKSIKTKLQKKESPQNFEFDREIKLKVGQGQEKLSAENVFGYIEGTDLKKEVVVVTAHYDHLGKHDGVVFNGADDDGSGTVAVMQMAKAFAEAKKQGKGPRRSMLFMCVAGEEKGLLGSDNYSRHPLFSLYNTVVDLNIDMIGRLDDKHKDNSNYVYIIGSDMLSKTLHVINDSSNKIYTKLELDYTFNNTSDPNRYYYRSDHYNFAKNNIPVIFYFNGVHADYHKETDEVHKIDFKKMEKITRLVFFTAWEIANRTERIKLDSKE